MDCVIEYSCHTYLRLVDCDMKISRILGATELAIGSVCKSQKDGPCALNGLAEAIYAIEQVQQVWGIEMS